MNHINITTKQNEASSSLDVYKRQGYGSRGIRQDYASARNEKQYSRNYQKRIDYAFKINVDKVPVYEKSVALQPENIYYRRKRNDKQYGAKSAQKYARPYFTQRRQDKHRYKQQRKGENVFREKYYNDIEYRKYYLPPGVKSVQEGVSLAVLPERYIGFQEVRSPPFFKNCILIFRLYLFVSALCLSLIHI